MMDKRRKRAAGMPTLMLAAGFGILVVEGASQYAPWTAPMNLGSPVNTIFAEQAPCLSKDGRSLYFHCLDCPGGFGGFDIWVAQRSSTDAPWQAAVNLGPTVNSPANENRPSLSIDGHRLYFNSDRPGGLGGQDLWVSQRHNKRDDLGWLPPENLGGAINSAANDTAPAHFEDDDTGVTTLYFTSSRPGGIGGDDIYVSVLQADGMFGAATVVAEISSVAADRGPTIRHDGRELIFASDRPGTFGNLDLWVSTRAGTADPWSEPENLGAVVNGPRIDAGPWLSFDGSVLYFHRPNDPANVSSSFDLWMTFREKHLRD